MAGQGQVAVVEGAGHVVEGGGQLAQFVPADHRDPVFEVPGPEVQHALMHTGHGTDEISGHPPTEVGGHGQGQAEQTGQGDDEEVLEIGAVGQALIHGVEGRGLDAG